MNPFFDISEKEELPIDSFGLRNLGAQKALVTLGRRASEYWRTSGTPSRTVYQPTTSEDYDQQFVYKLYNWKPVYNIDQVLDHHYGHYQLKMGGKREFLKHMRYVILPILKKNRNSEVQVELFEKWLNEKEGQGSLEAALVLNNIAGRGSLNKTVHRIHFDDLSWSDFERLIFAHVKRLRLWTKINWLGQLGQDEGQDIWGESQGLTYCFLCANYKALTFKKAKDDIDKLVKADSIPSYLIVVCGGKVSAGITKNINSYAYAAGIENVAVWSGADIEEDMRIQSPELISRFFNGQCFPEMEPNTWDDPRIVEELINCFNRPAFTNPFYREVSIPDFGKAITDTIEILNTGLHRLRDGILIRQIPSRHQLGDKHLKGKVAIVYERVVKLRDTFFDLHRKSEIESCKCGDADCPTYMLSDNACKKMDDIRQEIFSALREINPNLTLKFHK